MEVIQGLARLGPPFPETAAALAAPVARADAESALGLSGERVELLLDVAPVGGDGGEARSFNIALERPDLEELLRTTSGDELTLLFDGEAVRQAFDPDVEAQGFRERALVLTVAAATMVGAAGGASAATYAGGSASGTGTAQPGVSIVSDNSSLASGGGSSLTGIVTDAGSAGGGSAVTGLVTDNSPGGVGDVSAPTAVAAPGGGGVSLTTGEEAGIAAGIALLVTGVGFAALKGRRRPGEPGITPA